MKRVLTSSSQVFNEGFTRTADCSLRMSKKMKVTCGAKTRKGTACFAMPMPGKARCKFHGGASTGPRTVSGRARIADAQHKRWAKWREANANFGALDE
jgi:hypothetical protein